MVKKKLLSLPDVEETLFAAKAKDVLELDEVWSFHVPSGIMRGGTDGSLYVPWPRKTYYPQGVEVVGK